MPDEENARYKMRILMVSPAFQPAWDWGGPIRSTWNQARGLAGLGVNVTVLTTNARQRGIVNVPPLRVEEGVKIHTLAVAGSGHSTFANRFGLARGMARTLGCLVREADIVHLNGFFGVLPVEAATVSLVLRRPFVISARGTLAKWSLAQKKGKKQFFLNTIGRAVLTRSAGFHFTVEEERRQAPAWIAGDNGFVVPNAVEFVEPGKPERFRQRNGLDEDTLVLGIFGRIHKQKGFDVIIPALGKARCRDVVLAVAGPDEGGYTTELERLVRDSGVARQVIFAGLLSGQDLADAYAGIDVLMLPSYEENFGNVVVEAAVQGTPCVVSDQVGLKDWVAENDVGLVLPLDVDTWATALAGFKKEEISGRWKPERLAGLVRESFSIEPVARQMLQQYERILERPTEQ